MASHAQNRLLALIYRKQMMWDALPNKQKRTAMSLERRGLIDYEGDMLVLTAQGMQFMGYKPNKGAS